MLGDSSTTGLGSSSGGGGGGGGGGDASAAAQAASSHDVGGGAGSNSGEDDRIITNNNNNSNTKGEDILTSDRSFGGNRWPRQETIALLKIRSDMDVAFRDASVKGPLWDEVSRKLAELGYHRSAKKCKEKFENVYKYHKRTKEGRTGKSDGKTYRFFDQLEALENQLFSSSSPPPPTPATAQPKAQQASAMQVANTNNPPLPQNSTVPSISTTAATMPSQGTIMNLSFQSPFQSAQTNPTILAAQSQPVVQPMATTTTATNPTYPSAAAMHNIPADLVSNSMTTSSTSSDEELGEEETGGGGRRKRKRKWKDFFERLMKEVIQRQEELQKKFLEAIEKREHERIAREEAWRMQEISRINREREILAQERTIAAAKDAAVMSFLQKISEQQNQNPSAANINIPVPPIIQRVQLTPPPPQQPPPPPQPQPTPTPAPPPRPQPTIPNIENVPKLDHKNNGGEHNNIVSRNNNNNNNNSKSFMVGSASSSRWPKAEVSALIKLRTDLDAKYQENGPKGPLWEEISAAMRNIGYNRNAKRCKEKWENINKYFKKVKESNKKRPEDSKTCPYFHQLDALYREKNKYFDSASASAAGGQQFVKPENSVPLMVQPEQQWPPAAAPSSGDQNRAAEEMDRLEQINHEEEEEEEEEEDEDEDDDEEDEEGGNNYELVANKPGSNVNAGE